MISTISRDGVFDLSRSIISDIKDHGFHEREVNLEISGDGFIEPQIAESPLDGLYNRAVSHMNLVAEKFGLDIRLEWGINLLDRLIEVRTYSESRAEALQIESMNNYRAEWTRQLQGRYPSLEINTFVGKNLYRDTDVIDPWAVFGPQDILPAFPQVKLYTQSIHGWAKAALAMAIHIFGNQPPGVIKAVAGLYDDGDLSDFAEDLREISPYRALLMLKFIGKFRNTSKFALANNPEAYLWRLTLAVAGMDGPAFNDIKPGAVDVSNF